MAFDVLRKFRFFMNGWRNAGIFSLRCDVALITDIFALYFYAASIISLSDLGVRSFGYCSGLNGMFAWRLRFEVDINTLEWDFS